MPTILHAAVGLALGRLHAGRPDLRHSLVFAGLAVLPDADLLLHFAGVPYSAALGHRGAAHSLAAAALAGLFAAVLARRGRPLWTGLLVAATVASHGLLDMLTHGGHGVALFWPLEANRHAWPWQPLPAAPMGRRLFGEAGLTVLLAELPTSTCFLLLSRWPARAAARALGEPTYLSATARGPETLSSS